MAEKKTSIKRRDFAKLAGAAALAGPSLNVLGANDRVRVACVGYSDRFRGSLLPTFMAAQKDLNFDMVAVADLWKKRLYENAKPELEKKLGHAVETYTSDMDLYEHGKDIDAVIISTADFQHAQHATHAVNAGKDAYCEKPMAEDMYSANMLLDAVNAKRKAGFAPGAVLQIGSQRRSGPAYHAAKAFLESGRFGKLTYVDLCWNVNQNRRWRRDEKLVASLRKEDIDWNLWLLDRDPACYAFDPRKYLEFRLFWPFSSGIPGQWMCHQIDTVGWYTGLLHPVSAVASGGTYAWNDGRMSFDTFTTILEYGPSKLNDKGFQAVFSSRQTNSARGNVEKYYGARFIRALPDMRRVVGSTEEIAEQIEISIKYEGYIKRQKNQVEHFLKMEGKRIPADLDYSQVKNLRKEARQKLEAVRPVSLGQASRISGVSPADVSQLMLFLRL